MGENKVEDKNFVVLQGWMLKELGLKGNELIIYAIIYGFSHLEGQHFSGSRQYLADWTNSSVESVRKCLKSLVSKGYILKYEKYINNVKYCEYAIQQSCVVGNKVAEGRQQSCLGVGNKVAEGRQQSCSNNIDNNIKENIDNNIIVDFEELWQLYPRKEGKKSALTAYKKAVKAGTTKEEIKSGILKYIEYIKATETPTQYIKHGSTFFNQECWNDDFSTEGVKKNDWFSGANGYTEPDEENCVF